MNPTSKTRRARTEPKIQSIIDDDYLTDDNHAFDNHNRVDDDYPDMVETADYLFTIGQ